MLTISIVLFAFATIIAWEYQGEKAFEYLTGGCDRTQWYRLGYGLVTFLGAVCSLEAVWEEGSVGKYGNIISKKYNFQEI